jgi:hypothetical protein
MKIKLFLIFYLLHWIFFACSNRDSQKSTLADTVTEWVGKEIKFSACFQCNLQGKDTISTLCADLLDSEYKILLYVDSTGCTSCKLRLFEWRELMQESSKMFQEKVKFLFFFYPQNELELNYFLLRDRMDYPVFIDNFDALNGLNHFPSQPEYQCFLLDKDNKVLMLGNPVLNRKIWELYKQTIAGEKQASKPEELTTAQADKTVHDYGVIQKSRS